MKFCKKLLSVFLSILMVATMLTPAFAQTSQAAVAEELIQELLAAMSAEADTYASLRDRLIAARDNLRDSADTYGTVDFGNGYTLDLAAEMRTFADDIDFDLAVAAAIAAGDWNNATLRASMASQSNRNYSQANFNQTNGGMGNTAAMWEASALKYLTQGGVGSTRTTVNWAYGFGSKLNPDYRHSHSYVLTVLSVSENGKLPGGTTLADVAEDYAVNIVAASGLLVEKIGTLKALADIDAIKEEMLESPCISTSCGEGENCADWTHRLIISEADWNNSAADYVNKINRDIIILGDLATGRMDSGLATDNRNAYNYYNSDVTKNSTMSRINAALYYLENGGFHKGTTSGNQITGLSIANRVYYRSLFTEYNVSFSGTPVLGTGYGDEEGQDEIIPMVEFHRDVLLMGANPSNLQMIYNMRVGQINELIAQAKALRGTTVPEGGTMTQAEYDAAIEKIIADAERDLRIANALRTGDIQTIQNEADKFSDISVDIPLVGTVNAGYIFKNLVYSSADRRLTLAINYFRDGGHQTGIPSFTIPFTDIRIELEVTFKSNFHPEYSGGLFGIAANTENVIKIMGNVLEDLKDGNEYLTPFEGAKLRYETARAKMEEIKRNPGSIITSNLGNNEEMNKLIEDLELIVASLDDLGQLLDSIRALIDLVGEDNVNSLLGTLGLSTETLDGLFGMYDTMIETLVSIGIDPTGQITVRESIENSINDIDWIFDSVRTLIDGAFFAVDYTILLVKTESTYNSAADLLEGTYTTVMSSSTVAELMNSLLGMFDLGPVMDILDLARPILNEINSVVEMVNAVIKTVYDVQELIEEFNALIEDFNFLGLSKTTDKLADILENLADLLEVLDKSELGKWALELLSTQLSSDGLGGLISGGLADLLNSLVNNYLGSDLLNLSGDQLDFVGDTASELINGFLENPAGLVPLLRGTEDILRRASGISLGVHYILEVETTQNYDNYVLGVSTIVNSAFGKDVLNAAEIQECVDKIIEIVECIEASIEWAQENLTKENAKLFAQRLTVYFAGRIVDCIVNSEQYQIYTNIKDLAIEAYEIMSFILCDQGEFVITAQEDVPRSWYNPWLGKWEWTEQYAGDVFVYEDGIYPNSIYYTTNFDALEKRLHHAFDKMGIFFGYQINNADHPSFKLDDNTLLGGSPNMPTNTDYNVKVSYRLYIDLFGGISFLRKYNLPPVSVATLATKEIKIILGEAWYTVTLEADPDDGGVVSGISSSTGALETGSKVVLGYEYGEMPIFTATPNNTNVFVGWYDENGKVSDNASYQHFVMPQNVTLTAVFAPKDCVPVVHEQDPTCTEDGYYKEICEDCGKVIVDIVIPKTGHTPGMSDTVEATCTEPGYVETKCTVCGDTIERNDIAALGHDYETEQKQPTFTEEGYIKEICKRCGETNIIETFPKLVVELTGIEITSLPQKTEYFKGDTLDLTGMVVTAYYNDDSTKDVTAEVVTMPGNGAILGTVGITPVIVSYEGKTDVFDVTVAHAGIELTGKVKTYNPGNATTLQLKQGDDIIYTTTISAATGFGLVTQEFKFEKVMPGTYTLVIVKDAHTKLTVNNVLVEETDIDLTQAGNAELQVMTLPCGDVNGDGMINILDVSEILMDNNFYKSISDNGVNPLCELDGDGIINIQDMSIVLMDAHLYKGEIVIDY